MGRSDPSASPLSAADARWLAPPLLAGIAVAGIYLATNQYPAFGAGLYFAIVEEILACGYCLPETIPGYTADGVPLAYPPLAYYLLTVPVAAGIDPLTLSRLLPPAVTVLSLVPLYLFVRDLRASRQVAAVATLLVGVTPQILQWHISAGGVVRALALLLVFAGLYTGLNLFRTGGRRWLVACTAIFGLTVATHPTYTVFFVASYVLLWATIDRSPAGVGRGLLVGVGGAVLASPWWLTVAAHHGPSIFANAAGTHGGIGGGVNALDRISPWHLLPFAAGLVLLASGELLVPAWVVASELLFAQPRFVSIAGSVAVAVVVVERGVPLAAAALDHWGVSDAVRQLRPRTDGAGQPGRERVGVDRTLVVALLVVGTVVGPTVFATQVRADPDSTTPAFIDDADVAAMAWARTETDETATFVVLGDAAEWFPLLADRTILVGPWGVEWRGPAAYDRHLETYRTISDCQTTACIERELAVVGAEPTYLSVPTDAYTVRGHRRSPSDLPTALTGSDRYERVFRNDGVAVFRRSSGDSQPEQRDGEADDPRDHAESEQPAATSPGSVGR